MCNGNKLRIKKDCERNPCAKNSPRIKCEQRKEVHTQKKQTQNVGKQQTLHRGTINNLNGLIFWDPFSSSLMLNCAIRSWHSKPFSNLMCASLVLFIRVYAFGVMCDPTGIRSLSVFLSIARYVWPRCVCVCVYEQWTIATEEEHTEREKRWWWWWKK